MMLHLKRSFLSIPFLMLFASLGLSTTAMAGSQENVIYEVTCNFRISRIDSPSYPNPGRPIMISEIMPLDCLDKNKLFEIGFRKVDSASENVNYPVYAGITSDLMRIPEALTMACANGHSTLGGLMGGIQTEFSYQFKQNCFF